MLDALAQAAARTLVLAAIVQAVLWLLRIRRPPLRLAAWTVVLAASLVMPVLQWVTPMRLAVLPPLPAAASLATSSLPDTVQPAAIPSTPDPTPTDPLPWLEGVYLLGAGPLLARIGLGLALSMRLVGRARPVQADWAGTTPIRISPEVRSPVTVAQIILLPADAWAWSTPLREAVLAHERAHIARRDFAMLLLSQVNRAVFWFSPLPWWLHRRLAALAEVAADDQAMAVTRDRAGYAGVLLEMGRRSGPRPLGLAMARPATLHHRIERILADRAPTDPARPLQHFLLVGCAAGLSIVAASSGLRQAPSPEPARMAELATPAEPVTPLPVSTASDPLLPTADQTASAAPLPTPTAAPSPGIVRASAQSPPRSPPRDPPPRMPAQRPRTVRTPAADDGPFKTAAPAPRRDEGLVVAVRQESSPPTRAPTLAKADVAPSCTGVYVPQPGGSRANDTPNIVQARYFQEADGTPWLKLLLGQRTRARLTGLEVERTSIHTTVVMALPRGMNHVAGTARGSYGAIDYECAGANARS